MIWLKTIWLQFKLYIYVAAFVGWTWAVYDVTSTFAKAKALEEVAEKQAQAIKDQKASQSVSFDAGAAYEPKRQQINKRLTTPDRNLDDSLQGPAGDVPIPAELGMRLNDIARAAQAGSSASQPSR